MTGGMLPDGTATNSNRKYIDTWRGLGKFVLKHMDKPGAEVYGYDPGIRIHLGNGSFTDVDYDIVRAIANMKRELEAE